MPRVPENAKRLADWFGQWAEVTFRQASGPLVLTVAELERRLTVEQLCWIQAGGWQQLEIRGLCRAYKEGGQVRYSIPEWLGLISFLERCCG